MIHPSEEIKTRREFAELSVGRQVFLTHEKNENAHDGIASWYFYKGGPRT